MEGGLWLFSYSFAVIKNNSALKELLVKPKTSELKVTLSWSKVQGRKPWLPQAPRQPVYPVHRPAERVLGCGLPALVASASLSQSLRAPHLLTKLTCPGSPGGGPALRTLTRRLLETASSGSSRGAFAEEVQGPHRRALLPRGPFVQMGVGDRKGALVPTQDQAGEPSSPLMVKPLVRPKPPADSSGAQGAESELLSFPSSRPANPEC